LTIKTINHEIVPTQTLKITIANHLHNLFTGSAGPTEAGNTLGQLWRSTYLRKTIEDTYFGFGWAQMHNHADLILQLYGTARGRGRRYWGEQFVESDRLTHLLRLPEELEPLRASNARI
jgi:hypothetical protein